MEDDGSKIRVRCPDCGSDLVIDAASGRVIFHAAPRPSGKPEAKHDFDRLLSGLDASRAKAAEVFERELEALGDRDRLLEEKFREAVRRAEESPDEEPPLRPWDLD